MRHLRERRQLSLSTEREKLTDTVARLTERQTADKSEIKDLSATTDDWGAWYEERQLEVEDDYISLDDRLVRIDEARQLVNAHLIALNQRLREFERTPINRERMRRDGIVDPAELTKVQILEATAQAIELDAERSEVRGAIQELSRRSAAIRQKAIAEKFDIAKAGGQLSRSIANTERRLKAIQKRLDDTQTPTPEVFQRPSMRSLLPWDFSTERDRI